MDGELKQRRASAGMHDGRTSTLSIDAASRATRAAGLTCGNARLRSNRSAVAPFAWWLWGIGGGSLLLAAFVDSFFSSFSDRYAAVPFFVGLLTIGMWHGAFDSDDLLARKRWIDSLKGYGKYILVMVCAAAVFWFAPVPTIVAFLLLTAAHFGQEDWDFIRDVGTGGNGSPGGGRSSSATGIRILTPSLPALIRGLLVIGVPLVVHPNQTADFFRRVQLLVTAKPTAIPWQSATVSTAFWVMLGLAMLALILREGIDRYRMRIWFGESAVLAVAALTLNPEFFVGAYLLVWHAPRHLFGRFGPARRSNRATPSVMRSVFNSLIYLLPAWAAAAGLMLLRGERLIGWVVSHEDFHAVPWIAAVSAITVAIYIVVTPPHHLMQMRARR